MVFPEALVSLQFPFNMLPHLAHWHPTKLSVILQCKHYSPAVGAPE